VAVFNNAPPYITHPLPPPSGTTHAPTRVNTANVQQDGHALASAATGQATVSHQADATSSKTADLARADAPSLMGEGRDEADMMQQQQQQQQQQRQQQQQHEQKEQEKAQLKSRNSKESKAKHPSQARSAQPPPAQKDRKHIAESKQQLKQKQQQIHGPRHSASSHTETPRQEEGGHGRTAAEGSERVARSMLHSSSTDQAALHSTRSGDSHLLMQYVCN